MAKTKTAKVTDEFAAAMQQLSAEAEKNLPTHLPAPTDDFVGENAAAAPTEDLRVLTIRLEGLEHALLRKIDKLAATVPSLKSPDLAEEFRRIEEQLSAIRSSETVNQRLFDSLHDELLKYRDNFLHESLQKPFIHDLVLLFDDLTSLSDQLQKASGKDALGYAAQWRNNLENAIHTLMEILHRFDVMEIEPKEVVDRALHRVVSFEPADFPEEDGRIVMRVKRGFFWRGNLIRPEEVVAKRFG
jgi:molecular chaperone GrpE (heat shock protein)